MIKLTEPTIADKNLIYDLFVEGVNINVYQKKLTKDLNYLKAMANNMASCHSSIDYNTNRNVVNYMCTLDDKNIGFITLAYDFEKEEIEIWYFSIDRKYQHQGYGKKYFKLALEIIEKSKKSISVLVRTKNSEAMLAILKEQGFRQESINRQGFLCFHKNMNVILL